MNLRRVAIVVYPGIQSLDLAGPFEVFQGANVLRAAAKSPAAYDVRVVACALDPIASESGLSVVPHATFAGYRGQVDTLIVAGGSGTKRALADRALLRGVARLAKNARRVVSVCSGAFLLAEIGLLDGRRATTHWGRCAQLAARYPAVQVEHEPIYVRDGNVYTSAGVTAGIDLALALIEEDLGREVALQIARNLVVFLRRPGNQAQFSAQLRTQQADTEPLREVQRFIAESPGEDLGTPALARRAAMSVRNFTRCFSRQVGVSPSHYVESARLEAAQRRLVESQDGLEQVASCCGFGSAEVLRRAFVRRLDVTPSDYRTRFRSAH
jgi:transcriptional regulator GlxA family with amidase domain